MGGESRMKNKPFGFWLYLIVGVASIGFDIANFVLNYGDKTFSLWSFLLILFAGITQLLCCFFDVRFLPTLPPLLLGAGTALHIFQAAPSMSDLLNKIVFIGGNSRLALNLSISFAVIGLLSVLCGFFSVKKQNNGKEENTP